jgi:ketosteroid isomerase-like protein
VKVEGGRRHQLVVVLLMGVGLASCASQTSTRDQDVARLTAIQQELVRAWVAGDRAAIERIIAPEWKTTAPDGSTRDRAAVLRDVFETRVHKITRLDVDDVHVEVFGDAAVVTGRTRAAGEYKGTVAEVVIRFTDTFIRRDGRWQAVASHASLVQ